MAQSLPSTAQVPRESLAGNFLPLCTVGLTAGAVIALQIAIMRAFSVGGWAHFGSTVVALAMLGFGVASVLISLFKNWFEFRWKSCSIGCLLLSGPTILLSHWLVQFIPFNPIFLLSDSSQKWKLLCTFLLYLVPFASSALFLGIVFNHFRSAFSRFYSADLTGSGLAGLVALGAMYFLDAASFILLPVILWSLAAFAASFWLTSGKNRIVMILLTIVTCAIAAWPSVWNIPTLTVSEYKGISYARNLPDSRSIYWDVSPFGETEIYTSSYMHYAPGLSDNAAFEVPDLDDASYLGLYIDGDGPIAIPARVPAAASAYFRFLPMYYPYVLKSRPNVLVTQLGGGFPVLIAAAMQARTITVAESNPAILQALLALGPQVATSAVLAKPEVLIANTDARLWLAGRHEKYDVIDLSLADSIGLSNPAGFPIVERYSYTMEAFAAYMSALAPGGILAITIWNKEDPPKSVLKVYVTVAEAALATDRTGAARSLFAASSYLSTTTILYKKGGFSNEETEALLDHTRAMSFDALYYPGMRLDRARFDTLPAQYRAMIFLTSDNALGLGSTEPSGENPPATNLLKLAWQHLLFGDWATFARDYPFDIRPLTNDRPYFAGYIRIADLPSALRNFDSLQDEWGYILLWVSLAVATALAACLILVPVGYYWGLVFKPELGKVSILSYFSCLGVGYISVEVGLINQFTLLLVSPTISAGLLITIMLTASGAGSLFAHAFSAKMQRLLPVAIFLTAVILGAYALVLSPLLVQAGALPYLLRTLVVFLLVSPVGFLMGMPMAVGMSWLSTLRKDHIFVWAWGINGCFSVVGALMVPILAVNFGMSAILIFGTVAYLFALLAFHAFSRRSGLAFDWAAP